MLSGQNNKKQWRSACLHWLGGLSGDGETSGGMWGGVRGGHDDKGKIQTGQSFPFANRTPDIGSACSSTDRKPISLLLPLSFSLSFSSSFS